LDGKVVLITGGARGQGEAEARLFVDEGATVCITDVLVDEGMKVADDIAATFIEHDVTDPDAWAVVTARLVADHGRIDGLVNNAGIFRVAGLLETGRDLWDSIIAVNQTGVFLGLQAVAPIMIEQAAGSIVNISSIAGLQGSRRAFAYGASKWAVRGMTKSAALELAQHGVRVNSIHPGIIDTPMIAEFSLAGIRERVIEQIPNGHMADAADVARLALFLISDESAYSTGSEFVIDGGMTA
jgi:NAD(P)-dependent dehydrogenase (short-subunit alcohol dehydrogenase family)